jgi:hypothetical protein
MIWILPPEIRNEIRQRPPDARYDTILNLPGIYTDFHKGLPSFLGVMGSVVP